MDQLNNFSMYCQLGIFRGIFRLSRPQGECLPVPLNAPGDPPIPSPRHDSLTKMRIAHPAKRVKHWWISLGNRF